MDLAEILPLAIMASIALTVASLGLAATPGDGKRQRPALGVRVGSGQ